MTEPEAIDPATFFEQVTSAPVVVVFVSVHARHPFNEALPEHLQDVPEAEGPVRFATVSLPDLILRGSAILPHLHQALRACGAPVLFGVTPGYWLFRQGQLIAWHSGLPVSGDASTLAHSALLGALWTTVTGNLTFIGQALRAAADQSVAVRIARAFRQALAVAGATRASAARHPSAADDVRRAYEVLRVSPEATTDEVNAAWKRRRVECHPDRAGDDRAEHERRSRLSVEINRARDVILAARLHKQRRAS